MDMTSARSRFEDCRPSWTLSASPYLVSILERFCKRTCHEPSLMSSTWQDKASDKPIYVCHSIGHHVLDMNMETVKRFYQRMCREPSFVIESSLDQSNRSREGMPPFFIEMSG